MELSPLSPSRPAVSPQGRASVRAIARAVGRGCSRPACGTPAAATLVFSYEDKVARVVELLEDREPQAYDLCIPHADRTTPPMGWALQDTRVPRDETPRRLSDDSTVAVIAAALRGDALPTRVEVLVGGRVDEPEPSEPSESWLDDLHDLDGEDPLRAALEEVQRVVEPDGDAPGAVPSPLRGVDPKLW